MSSFKYITPPLVWYAYFNTHAIPDTTTKLVVAGATAVATYTVLQAAYNIPYYLTQGAKAEKRNKLMNEVIKPALEMIKESSDYDTNLLERILNDDKNGVPYARALLSLAFAIGCANEAYTPIHSKLTEMAITSMVKEKAANTNGLPAALPASAPAQ